MNNKEPIIRHLEIIQGVINRLAHNSFLVKGWSMAIVTAAILFLSKETINPKCIILIFLIPVIGFWILDGYFPWQERLFRGIYNDVRKQNKTDFEMNIPAQKSKPKGKWLHAIFSVTLVIFYTIEATFIAATFFILNYH